MNINQKIAEVERILDYVFVNELLCAEAIQMAAPVSALSINGRTHFVPANKRLSVLGDAIATSVLCKAWYSYRDENGTLAHESFLS
jgi:ribonuclease-3